MMDGSVRRRHHFEARRHAVSERVGALVPSRKVGAAPRTIVGCNVGAVMDPQRAGRPSCLSRLVSLGEVGQDHRGERRCKGFPLNSTISTRSRSILHEATLATKAASSYSGSRSRRLHNPIGRVLHVPARHLQWAARVAFVPRYHAATYARGAYPCARHLAGGSRATCCSASPKATFGSHVRTETGLSWIFVFLGLEPIGSVTKAIYQVPLAQSHGCEMLGAGAG